MPPDGVVLREARPEDALALSVLSTAVWIDTYATAGVRPTIAREVSQQFDAERLRHAIDESAAHWLIAAEGEHVLGYAAWHPGTHADEPATRGGCELDTLYVLARFAGQGIGARLLREAIRRCTRRCLWTTAWVGNPRARRFYEREGFTLRRIVDHAFEGEHHDNWLLVHAPTGAE
jgi:diamine N-acetyltransferase